jgi:hypothetical protein
MMLATVQNTECLMTRRLINNELEGIWKEVDVTYLRYPGGTGYTGSLSQ